MTTVEIVGAKIAHFFLKIRRAVLTAFQIHGIYPKKNDTSARECAPGRGQVAQKQESNFVQNVIYAKLTLSIII